MRWLRRQICRWLRITRADLPIATAQEVAQVLGDDMPIFLRRQAD
jgi:hypothetical protein